MVNRKGFRVLYSIFIVLILLSFLFMFLALAQSNADDAFDDRQYVAWGEQWTATAEGAQRVVDLPVDLNSTYNATVVITKQLPATLNENNCLMIEGKRQEIAVYVDDVLRAQYENDGQRIGNSLPSKYLMVPIYNTDANAMVRVELTTNTYYSGDIANIYLGSEMSILLMIFKTYLPWVVIIGVIFIIGLVCLSCFFVYRSTFDKSIQFLQLFWFSLFTTVFCYSQLGVRQVFVSDLSTWESIGHCCFMLIPLAILLISNYFSGYKHAKFHMLCIIMAIINFLTQNILHTAFGMDYFQMQTVTQIYMLWILITCIGSCIIETVKGEISGKNFVVVGFLGQTMGILTEAILTGMGVKYTHLSIYVMGSFVFLIAISLNTFLDFRKEQLLKKEAENANKAKSLFLATMSHEIRTPINVVLGMNEMILRETTDDTIREYAGNVSEAGKSLLSLVNDVLDFSKIEAGKMEIVAVDYQMKPLLNDLIMMTRTRIGSKPLRLELAIDEKMPSKYHGDEVRIKQIVTNILTNAVKYTASGTITLSVREMQRIGDDAVLRFSVKDTGMGMREEDVDKLLTSTFIRVDEKKNRNIEGTGLGVAIVRQLLKLMDSQLRVDSVYGEGSDFYFELRQKVVDETAMGTVERKTIAKKKKKNTFTAPNACVLAVDDTKPNLLVIKGLLKPYGMTVETVASGEECIARCKDVRYDIIFMDHMMPQMDGIETLEALKKENLLPSHTKVIALTANAISGAEEMYLGHGFDGYMTKPIDAVELDACVKKYLPAELIQELPPEEGQMESV